MELVDANVELIIRDQNLRDAGEITKFITWKSTLKLDDVSSWQIETQTNLFESYEMEPGLSGIIFKRDGETLLTGPLVKVNHTSTEGEERTVMYGACDLKWLESRMCYPVVGGLSYDAKDDGYYFSHKIVGNGLWAPTLGTTQIGATEIQVGSVIGYKVGARVWALGPVEFLGTIYDIDENSNTLLITNLDNNGIEQGIPSELEEGCGISQDTSMMALMGDPEANTLVDDPDFKGYDKKEGPGETVAKWLVQMNAAQGACTDLVGSRIWPHLYVANDLARGRKITSYARGENLLQQVQDVCRAAGEPPGGLHFDVMQEGAKLIFDCYTGVDQAENDALVFSKDLGNLKDYDYTYGIPKANMVLGYGPGSGAKRRVYPSGVADSIAAYGRWEGWVSDSKAQVTDTNPAINAYLITNNTSYLATESQNAEVTVSLQETDQIRYPRDFRVGDIASIWIGHRKFRIPITAVDYTIPSSSGGAASSAVSAALMRRETRQMRTQRAHSRMLERLHTT